MAQRWLEQLVLDREGPLNLRRWALRQWVSRSSLPYRFTLDHLFHEYGSDTLSRPPAVTSAVVEPALGDSMNFLMQCSADRRAAREFDRARRTATKRRGEGRQPGKADPEPNFRTFPNVGRHYAFAVSGTHIPMRGSGPYEFIELKYRRQRPNGLLERLDDEIAAAATALSAPRVWVFALERVILDSYRTNDGDRAMYCPTVFDSEMSRYCHPWNRRVFDDVGLHPVP